MKNTGLVWFKNDLRLLDNETLIKAIEECDQLLYFYCFDIRNYRALDLGFLKVDVIRLKFLYQSLDNLQKNLETLGAHLIVKHGHTEEEIGNLIKKFGISRVYAEQEYASEELNIINKVTTLHSKIKFNFYWGRTLYHIEDIPFTIDKIPLTSKAYRIPTAKNSKVRTTFGIPNNLKAHTKAKSTSLPSVTNFGFTDKTFNEVKPIISGGENNALERWNYYSFQTQLLTTYRWTRNRSEGLDYSSKISPYLALGCISPRFIYFQIKDYENQIKKNQSTWWFVFELVWRDYFTFKHMRFGNEIFHTNGYRNKHIEFENNPEKFEKWKNGTTGIPFVDAHIRQLNQTGFMSNRGRVNAASYLIHDLKINWTWGASYFESKLVDYDVSSNWMNWHTQAFEIWYTNPIHQSFKYKGQDFIRKWIPELNKENDMHTLLPWLKENLDYPKPIMLYEKWNRSIQKIIKHYNSSTVE